MSRVLSNEVTLLNIAGNDNDIKDAFTREMLGCEEPLDVSTKDYHPNQFFIWKDRKYYKTLANIAVSERFVLGTNIKEMTIGEVLAELYQVNPAVVMQLIGYEEEDEYPVATPYVIGQYIVRQGNLWRIIKNVGLTDRWQPGVNIELVYNIGEAIYFLEQRCYESIDPEVGSIENNDYMPLLKSDGSTRKKIKFSSLVAKIKGIFAPFSHADSTTNHGGGTSSLFGHVKLSDKYTSSDGSASQSVAASSKAVNDSYKSLNDAKAPKNHASTTTTYGIGNGSNFGHVKLSDTYASNVGAAANGIGASQKGLNDLYKVLNGRITGDVRFSMGSSSTGIPCLLGTFSLNGQNFYLMLYFQYPNQDGNRRLIVFDKDWNTIWQI